MNFSQSLNSIPFFSHVLKALKLSLEVLLVEIRQAFDERKEPFRSFDFHSLNSYLLMDDR
jgi:hypothetical protein